MSNFVEISFGLKSIYNKTFNETIAPGEELATTIKSNDLSEKYVWLGDIPQMKEWVGDRDIKKFNDYGYALSNKLYENSVSIPQTHLDYDKVGLYRPAIEQMAQDAKKFGASLVASVLINGADPAKGKCYDDKAFFATDHKINSDTYANLSDKPLNATNLLAAEMFMRSIKGNSGRAIGIAPTHLVIGASNLAKALEILQKQNLSGGESNVVFNRYKLITINEISDGSWYLMDLSRAIKPFILQKAIDGEFSASNDYKFMKDAALFGCKSFMNAGYGLWQLAYKGGE